MENEAARDFRYAVGAAEGNPLMQARRWAADCFVHVPGAGVDDAPTLHLRTRDPHEALAELGARERRHVFLEGGPTLAAAFLAAGLVDEVVAYVAPFLLGAGHSAVADLGITTIAGAWRPEVLDVAVLEPVVDGEQPDVRFTLAPPAPTPPARGDA